MFYFLDDPRGWGKMGLKRHGIQDLVLRLWLPTYCLSSERNP